MFKSLREKLSGWVKKKSADKFVEEDGKEGKEKTGKKEKGEKKKVKKTKKAGAKKNLKEVLPEKQDIKAIEEEIIEQSGEDEEKESEPSFFTQLKKKLSTSVLTQEQFDEAFEDLEMTLLENNVALEVVDKIHDSLSKDLVNISVKKKEIEKTILESLKNSILDVLVGGGDLVKKFKKELGMKVVLFFGINGSGKTTSIAKFAYLLKKAGVSCVLVAADTFRAASIEQLEEHADKIGVPIVKGGYGADPASVAFDGVNYAKKNKIKIVLVDTAGRMYTQGNLMREMEKIVRVSKPDLKIFVGESITGNDAVSQARSFDESIGIDGVILSKADVDEKAGTILSVGYVTGKPIYYLGVGQGYCDLKVFKKEDVLKNLGLD